DHEPVRGVRLEAPGNLNQIEDTFVAHNAAHKKHAEQGMISRRRINRGEGFGVILASKLEDGSAARHGDRLDLALTFGRNAECRGSHFPKPAVPSANQPLDDASRRGTVGPKRVV